MLRVLVSSAALGCQRVVALAPELHIPKVDLAKLEAKDSAEVSSAESALSSLGAVAVVGVEDFSQTLTAWADCLVPDGKPRDHGDIVTRPLGDGSVVRTTAAATGAWN